MSSSESNSIGPLACPLALNLNTIPLGSFTLKGPGLHTNEVRVLKFNASRYRIIFLATGVGSRITAAASRHAP